MTVLVTGGAGYIGNHMVLALRDARVPVVVVDDLSTGPRDAVPPDVPLVIGCVGNKELIRDTIQRYNIFSVVHFAGSIVVPESISDPIGYYVNNTANSLALIAAALTGGVRRFVFSSTAAVYGEGSNVALAEGALLNPISPYGASKLMTERMLADAATAYGLRYVALRYFNVAGADPQGRSGQSSARATHLIKIATQAALKQRDHLDCFGTDYPTPDGTCIRDYIHVSDLAQAHLLALDYLEGGGKTLVANCGYGKGSSVRDVIASTKRVSGVDFAVRYVERRAGDPAYLVADSTRLREILGWRARYDDLDMIVSSALSWEKRLSNH